MREGPGHEPGGVGEGEDSLPHRAPQMETQVVVGERRRLVTAVGVSEWSTFIDHAVAIGEIDLARDLVEEQMLMLNILLDRDGYLFYPGHTDLTEGPDLARRFCTERWPEIDAVPNRE